MPHHKARLGLWVTLLVMLAQGCDKGSQAGAMIGASEPRQTELPRVEVKLPPSPSFKKEHPPANYDDGSFSVYGLRKSLDQNIDKDTKVTGYVVEIYECPPCPRGSACDPCNKPHFWLADKSHETKEKGLMVTDYPERHPKTHKPLKLQIGERVIVSGQFTKTSGTGFRASDGLVVYAEHDVARSATTANK